MDSKEQIEIALRASQIAKTMLELLEVRGTQSARLRVSLAAKQFNELVASIDRIEAKESPKG